MGLGNSPVATPIGDSMTYHLFLRNFLEGALIGIYHLQTWTVLRSCGLILIVDLFRMFTRTFFLQSSFFFPSHEKIEVSYALVFSEQNFCHLKIIRRFLVKADYTRVNSSTFEGATSIRAPFRSW